MKEQGIQYNVTIPDLEKLIRSHSDQSLSAKSLFFSGMKENTDSSPISSTGTPKCSMQCAVCSLQFQCAVNSVQSAVNDVQCALNGVQCVVCSVQCRI